MNVFSIPWLELTLAVPMVGAAMASRARDSREGWRIGFGFAIAATACAFLAWLGHLTGAAPGGATSGDVIPRLLGTRIFALDDLNAPLLPFIALLNFLMISVTTGGKAARLSFAGLLLAEAIQLATFSTTVPWALVVLLSLGALLPFLELDARHKPTRVYGIHAILFVALLTIGVGNMEASGDSLAPLTWIPLTLAIFLRCGIVPGHLWVGDLFEHASFGTAILYVTPMTGVYLAVRLVVPECPVSVLEAIGYFAVATAVYAAGLAVVQYDARRFVACLSIGTTGLVLGGLSLHTELGVMAALSLWVSAAFTLTALALALRAVEARVGTLSLREFRGLYDRAPALAVCFLIAGLATVGFPGTVGFLPIEVLVARAVVVNPVIGACTVLAIALNGFAVLRAYALVFTGGRHVSAVPLGMTRRERYTVFALVAAVLVEGLIPQPLLDSRRVVAETLVEQTTRGTKHGSQTGPTSHVPE